MSDDARDMPVAYVAVPYRDARGEFYVRENIHEAAWVAGELCQLGFAVICPHMNMAHFSGCVDESAFIRGDLEILIRCDLLVTTSDWERSSGAKVEVEYASNCGIPVYHWPDDYALVRTYLCNYKHPAMVSR